MFPESLLADRTKAIEASGIRKIFDLGRSLKNPVNLSIGQPHFPVPEPIRNAAKAAIDGGHNGYLPTQGLSELRERLQADAKARFPGQERDIVVTSGTSGGLLLALLAVVRLREKPTTQSTLFVAVESFEKLGQLLKMMDARTGGTLSAFEVMWNNFYTLVTTAPAKSQPPLPQTFPFYVLIEALGADEAVVQLALETAYEEGLIADAVVASSEAQRLQLWGMRDDVEQTFRYSPSFTFDVSLRLSRMEAYVNEVNRRLAEGYVQYTNFTFGHMGDGNLHFVISVGAGGPEHRQRVESCVYEPLRDIGGSVSAEHGVGLEKKPWLAVSRSADEIGLMRTLKHALDPKGLLNAGKVFDRVS